MLGASGLVAVPLTTFRLELHLSVRGFYDGFLWMPLVAKKQRLLLLFISLKSRGGDVCCMSQLAYLLRISLPVGQSLCSALLWPKSRPRGKDPFLLKVLILTCRIGMLKGGCYRFSEKLFNFITLWWEQFLLHISTSDGVLLVTFFSLLILTCALILLSSVTLQNTLTSLNPSPQPERGIREWYCRCSCCRSP